MNKLLFTIAMSASILCNAAFADNKVKNGGFERKIISGFFEHTNQIDHWEVLGGAKGELQKSGHTGKQHLELASNKGYRIRQRNISVVPGEKYIFSFYAKHRTAKYAKLHYGIKGGGKCAGSGKFQTVTKKGWTKYSHCICPKSRKVTVWFEQKGSAGGGYGIHLDDVRIAN